MHRSLISSMCAQSPPMMNTAVTNVDCGISSDCTLTVNCNGKRFIVTLSPNHRQPGFNGSSSIEGPYLLRLGDALKSRNELEIDFIIEEISDLVVVACQPVFRQLASPVIRDDSEAPQDLDTFLNPETFKLQLVTNDGKLEAIRVKDKDDSDGPISALQTLGFSASTINTNLPKIPLRQITLVESILGDLVMKVSVAGQLRCCKIATRWGLDQHEREVHSMQSITESNLSSSLRVPRCHGLVMTEDNRIIGILMDYVPGAKALSLFDIDAVGMDRRKKWAGQIRNIIDELHKAQMIWGDAKACNILIDSDDDAWVIDFGGSWTDGWVTAELAGTVKGDMQGLARILEYLKV